MGVGGQHHAPAALLPGKTRYPLYSRLDGPQGRCGLVQKISAPPGFDPGPSSPQRVAIPTELSRPTFIVSLNNIAYEDSGVLECYTVLGK